MNQYTYNGPVMEFAKCIATNWRGTTFAVSEKKARANLVHQYKVQTGRVPSAKITLPGNLTCIESEEEA